VPAEIMMNNAGLHRDLSAFRAAIERYVSGTPHPLLCRFPDQTCKTVSMLTARFLRERGWGDALLVANGNRSRKATEPDIHAWLNLNAYTIDLTADQYTGELRPVIVVPEDNSKFHKSFRGQCRYPWNEYMRFNPEYQSEHDEMYAGIMACMDPKAAIGCS
jgi:hypothetical protein